MRDPFCKNQTTGTGKGKKTHTHKKRFLLFTCFKEKKRCVSCPYFNLRKKKQLPSSPLSVHDPWYDPGQLNEKNYLSSPCGLFYHFMLANPELECASCYHSWEWLRHSKLASNVDVKYIVTVLRILFCSRCRRAQGHRGTQGRGVAVDRIRDSRSRTWDPRQSEWTHPALVEGLK